MWLTSSSLYRRLLNYRLKRLDGKEGKPDSESNDSIFIPTGHASWLLD